MYEIIFLQIKAKFQFFIEYSITSFTFKGSTKYKIDVHLSSIINTENVLPLHGMFQFVISFVYNFLKYFSKN